jgi:hypothetical protein
MKRAQLHAPDIRAVVRCGKNWNKVVTVATLVVRNETTVAPVVGCGRGWLRLASVAVKTFSLLIYFDL